MDCMLGIPVIRCDVLDILQGGVRFGCRGLQELFLRLCGHRCRGMLSLGPNVTILISSRLYIYYTHYDRLTIWFYMYLIFIQG